MSLVLKNALKNILQLFRSNKNNIILEPLYHKQLHNRARHSLTIPLTAVVINKKPVLEIVEISTWKAIELNNPK